MINTVEKIKFVSYKVTYDNGQFTIISTPK
jgi:hypothetical protein